MHPFYDYPLVALNQRIFLEDSLFLSPTRLYLSFLTSSTKPSDYSIFTSCLYFLHVHEPSLAFNLVRYFNRSKHLTLVILLKQLGRLKNMPIQETGLKVSQKHRQLIKAMIRYITKRERVETAQMREVARQVKMEAGNRAIKKVRERYNAVRGHAVKGNAQEIIRGLLCGTDANRLERAVVKSKQVFE
jgi:hypothetical protein